MKERWRIVVQGLVQGVGFRPFVYRLATQKGLTGFVQNNTSGVVIELEGERPALEACLRTIQEEPPPLAVMACITHVVLPPRGDTAFTIAGSQTEEERYACVSPDTCICDDCLQELLDPSDRRYRYPFINCTHCGPRFTITQDVPYDRERTTMADFQMCHACQAEYEDPTNRRFHAQPNACPRCGPHVQLIDRYGLEMTGEDPLAQAAQLLQHGAIVAVKGLGGYHLACDACNDAAVNRLRQQKQREDKPFALLARDMAAVQRLCEVNTAEEAMLQSRQRPIVLLRKRASTPIARGVSPGHRDLGVMLPYTPLHHLLLGETGLTLVMTSGNLSEEPIAYKDEEALRCLSTIADYFLVHNRPIHIRCDDAVTRLLNGQELRLRRSRGYVPEPIAMPVPFTEPVLACGAQLKNTFCLAKGSYAFVSHHIGDLENYETFTAFTAGIEHFQRLFDIQPTVVAYDLHPEYLSSKYAVELHNMTGVSVQHHHAHIASCMAEYGLAGRVIGVAFDGSGYGTDGTLWGGEFLVADYLDFTRVAHLEYIPLPGGEQAIRQPWRMAATYLHAVYGEDMHTLGLDFMHRLDRCRWDVLQQMLRKGINSPLTSSIGRLFDAVSCLVGGRDMVSYEGQAAVDLEMLADETCETHYPYTLDDRSSPMVLRVHCLIRDIVQDLMHSTEPAHIAAKFHHTLAEVSVAVCARIRAQEGLERVILSGGVFQNAFLVRSIVPRLVSQGFRVYVPSKLPPNDGGISLGQAAVANARVRVGRVERPTVRVEG